VRAIPNCSQARRSPKITVTSRTACSTAADLGSRYKNLGRGWAIKEHFAHFWSYYRESIARKFFAGWYHWAKHSRIPTVIEAARTVKRHF
jgi:hypothetical protein